MKARTASAIIALGIGLSPAVFAQTGNPPRPRSEPGLDCMVGLGPQGCQKVFEDPASHRYTFCADEYVWRHLGCGFGPLETVEYLGTNAAGEDVYSVSWMQLKHSIFILPPPGPDGKIGHGPMRRTDSDLKVTAPAHMILYDRQDACRRNNWDCGVADDPVNQAAIRSEIAHHLQLAERFAQHYVYYAAREQLKEASSYPDKTNAEEEAVAEVAANIAGLSQRNANYIPMETAQPAPYFPPANPR